LLGGQKKKNATPRKIRTIKKKKMEQVGAQPLGCGGRKNITNFSKDTKRQNTREKGGKEALEEAGRKGSFSEQKD